MLIVLHKIAEKLAVKPSKNLLLSIGIFFVLLCGLFYHFFIAPPANFPLNSVYLIEEKSALSEIASNAKKEGLIRSPLVFKILLTLISGNKGVISGNYVLNSRGNVFNLAKRFSAGDYRLFAVKITIPEGIRISEIAEILSKNNDLRSFKKDDFLILSKDKEGYLYPDTYFFLPYVKAKQIIETMEGNFNNKVSPIQNDIKRFGKTLKEILTMASILEEEVRTTEDRKIVAGILWKRIKMGIPLQVDAVFPYITQKKNGLISRDDLKINSPYNTYLNKGLPPGPISNPSLDAIIASINPTETKYLFYLSDKKGATHYAKTLEEHNNNVAKYLR